MMLRAFILLVAAALLVGCGTSGRIAGGAGGAVVSANRTTQAASAGANTPETRELARTVGNVVNFAFDSAELSKQATDVLQKQVAFLKDKPGNRVVIEGHCDIRGTDEYNLALGERRANAVREYLVARGIPASRITTISFGKRRPVATGNRESAHARNRRGVTVIN